MFTGREYYLDCLDSLWRKGSSSLAVVSGRRRIGKSTLVETFAARSNCRFVEIEEIEIENIPVDPESYEFKVRY